VKVKTRSSNIHLIPGACKFEESAVQHCSTCDKLKQDFYFLKILAAHFYTLFVSKHEYKIKVY